LFYNSLTLPGRSSVCGLGILEKARIDAPYIILDLEPEEVLHSASTQTHQRSVH
jgi:hypothetical protein